MDDKEFKAKLSELTEWEIPKISSFGNAKKPDAAKRGPKCDLELEDTSEDEEEDSILLPDGTNPTVRPRILKLKNTVRPCEDCGQVVENRTVQIRKYFNVCHGDHWRKTCSICDRVCNPETGQFDLKGYQQVGDFFRKYVRKKRKQ